MAATDTYSLYNANMGTNARGGITQTGSSGGYTYAVRTSMGDKPVNYVTWFSAARMANWLHNGATGTSSTETGAYTLVGGQTSGTVPARNPGALAYVPTEDEWYEAAYYKGGGTNAGYWHYATQVTGTAPTATTSGSTGIGSVGGTGNAANYNNNADWNSQNGDVTTVGTNGGPSPDLFDMSGNVAEWNDLNATASEVRGLRGGRFSDTSALSLSRTLRSETNPSNFSFGIGFRLAAPVPVPEPTTWALGASGLAGVAWLAQRQRA